MNVSCPEHEYPLAKRSYCLNGQNPISTGQTMRKLTEEELQAMTLLGRGRRSEFSKTLLSLAVGEALFLAKHEWKKKYHPGDAMRRVGRTHGRKFELLADVNGTGWVVKRVG